RIEAAPAEAPAAAIGEQSATRPHPASWNCSAADFVRQPRFCQRDGAAAVRTRSGGEHAVPAAAARQDATGRGRGDGVPEADPDGATEAEGAARLKAIPAARPAP